MAFAQLYTGDGKGKTTAAFGLALRAIGRGQRVFIGQFLKHHATGEALALISLPGVEHQLFGLSRKVGDAMNAKDKEAAAKGLELAQNAVSSGAFNVVVLDELNVALAKNIINLEDVLSLIAQRHTDTELVITGRWAHDEVIAAADLVTCMECVKHYAQKGVLAREGIEY